MRTPLSARLRERDYRLTSQRRVVAEVVDGDNLHLSADDVLARAREVLPAGERHGMVVHRTDVVHRGRCADCLAASG